MLQKYYIGMDISKSKIDVSVIDQKNQVVQMKVIDNKDSKIGNFLKNFINDHGINADELVICCENTGVYTNPLMRVCTVMALVLWVEQAFKIKRATTDIRGKSDAKDAHRIAEYAKRYLDRLVRYKEPSKMSAILNAKSKMRSKFVDMKVALQNELREYKSHDQEKYKLFAKEYNPMLKACGLKIKQLDKEIKSILGQDSQVIKNVQLLCSIPGIGFQTAINFIIETDNFTKFSSAKHLACYAGVVPFLNESGTIVRKPRVSKMANQKLKQLLHLAAMAASRSKSDLKQYFIRKVIEGKNKMCVLNAIRNKLVHRMWSVIARQEPYQLEMPRTLSIG